VGVLKRRMTDQQTMVLNSQVLSEKDEVCQIRLSQCLTALQCVQFLEVIVLYVSEMKRHTLCDFILYNVLARLLIDYTHDDGTRIFRIETLRFWSNSGCGLLITTDTFVSNVPMRGSSWLELLESDIDKEGCAFQDFTLVKDVFADMRDPDDMTAFDLNSVLFRPVMIELSWSEFSGPRGRIDMWELTDLGASYIKPHPKRHVRCAFCIRWGCCAVYVKPESGDELPELLHAHAGDCLGCGIEFECWCEDDCSTVFCRSCAIVADLTDRMD
jgi:hypothetical protein